MTESPITVDATMFLQAALLLVQFLFGWMVKSLFDRIKTLESRDSDLAEKIGQLSVNLPTNYVQKAEFQKMGDDIFNVLRRIEDKLDGKQDKP